jgi:hypothetical protein
MPSTKKNDSDLYKLLAEIRDLTDRVPSASVAGNANASKHARQSLEILAQKLAGFAAKLDPIARPDSIFDPSDPQTAGRVVALTLVAQGRHRLDNIPNFYGSGVYAIYYNGTFPEYAPLSKTDHPIYVGKADPDNPAAKDAVSQGAKLCARLSEHAKNIDKAKDSLSLADFECRFLIVQTGFQKSAESYLIEFFKPIWNSETKVCFGLGKHGDSAETRGNKRSPWDTLHPGRSWADASEANQKEPAKIREEIAEHFKAHSVFRDIHEIFDKIIAGMVQLNKFGSKDGQSFKG